VTVLGSGETAADWAKGKKGADWAVRFGYLEVG